MQRHTQPIQNVAAVTLTLRMKHSMQSRVGNTRRFLEPIATPALTLKNLLQCADDHAGIIGQLELIVNELVILKVLFTYYKSWAVTIAAGATRRNFRFYGSPGIGPNAGGGTRRFEDDSYAEAAFRLSRSLPGSHQNEMEYGRPGAGNSVGVVLVLLP